MSWKHMRTLATGLVIASLALAACTTGAPGGGGSSPVTSAPSADPSQAGSGEPVTLTLGSWRTEDLAMWEDEILPAFSASHPGITVEFTPTNTNEYNAAIQSQVEGGTGPDLITCRPFDVNRAWIADGFFVNLDGLPALDAFEPGALTAWLGDDGSPYCVPVAAVLAGFYYNKAIFTELGLEVPTTHAEFLAVLDAVKANGTYEPLALGSADSWQLGYNGLYNIGPAYWKGEEGRLGLIDGTKKVTDPEFVAAIAAFEDWEPYLPEGYESLEYGDMTQLFALGRAAILPDGSWNINQIVANGIDVGVFGPPVPAAGDQRYLQEMPDMAIGINAASPNQDAAKVFLEWVAGPEFLELYVNKVPGFFSMANTEVTYTNELAQAFANLKDGAELTPRLGLDRVSAGTPPFDDEVWRLLQVMYTSDTTPEEVAQELQEGLASWYEPQQGR